jgi:hypothetical protein
VEVKVPEVEGMEVRGKDPEVTPKNRYAGASKGELIRALDQLHGVHNAALHEILLVSAELDRVEAPRQDGQRSLGSWLQIHLGVSHYTARRWADAAVKVEELPHLSRAFSEGRISFDKFATSAAIATPDDDEEIASIAEKGSIAGCEAEVRRRKMVSEDEEARARLAKRLTFRWVDSGTRMLLTGSLPADEGATVKAAIQRLADSLPMRDEEGRATTLAEDNASALLMMAQTRVAEDQDPDRATLVVNVDLDDLIDGNGGGEEGGGAVFSSSVMQRIACDARLQPVIRDGKGDVVGVGRVLRTAPAYIRRILQSRDGGCRFPGCANTRFVDVHHIRWWTRGGSTDLTNLALLCRAHHRLVHKRGWMLKGDPNEELEFVDPEGRPVSVDAVPLEHAVKRWLENEILPEVPLLPLDGAGGLRRDVVHDAVDTRHLVDDPGRDRFEQVVGKTGPISRHRVVTGNSS